MDRDPPAASLHSLDPSDWQETASLAHRMVDFAIDHLRSLREQPVWTPMGEEVRTGFAGPLPAEPQTLDAILGELRQKLFPHAMGNHHPRFWSWYMGSGSFTGALGDFLAAIEGSNLGAGDTAASLVDQQVTRWIITLTGFPETASAALVGGGSMANIVGLTAARNAMAEADLRQHSLADLPHRLVFYASDQVHSCHLKAMNLLGLGAASLRRIATDDAFRMDVAALRTAIDADRGQGRRPACVIATAGTTNTGAVDPLSAIADLCRDEGLWLHVDGCIGALMALSPRLRPLLSGMERAQSLALDLHKWLHVPFDAGCIIVRDRTAHRNTFAAPAEYLSQSRRGLASGEMLCDFTPETTRSFRALKIWMMLKQHGAETFGKLIERNVAQARLLAQMVEAQPKLSLMAPVETSIVCLRHDPGGMDETALRAHNREILLRLQESGVAAPSDTTLRGRYCLRVAICNHRTSEDDLALFLAEVMRIGSELAGTTYPRA